MLVMAKREVLPVTRRDTYRFAHYTKQQGAGQKNGSVHRKQPWHLSMKENASKKTKEDNETSSSNRDNECSTWDTNYRLTKSPVQGDSRVAIGFDRVW